MPSCLMKENNMFVKSNCNIFNVDIFVIVQLRKQNSLSIQLNVLLLWWALACVHICTILFENCKDKVFIQRAQRERNKTNY